MFQKAGRPRFKSFRRGLNSIEGSDNREIMYKPKLGSIVWRKHAIKYMKPDTVYMRKSEHQRVNGPERSILVNSGTIFPKLHALLGI